ncbi:MAG: hypothetical protein IKZ38_03030 [Clostridia bacterium]|nr:hypothetical protein [Clostridia bacterium]
MGKIIVFLQSLSTVSELPIGGAIMAVLIPLLFAIALYVLRSIGIYTLAKRNGEKPWMAWIPGLWIYPVCMLVKNEGFFGRPVKKFAVLFTVIITVLEVLNILYYFLLYFPVVGYFFSGGYVYLYLGDGIPQIANQALIPYLDGTLYVTSDIVYPYANMNFIVILLNTIGWIGNVLSFVEAIITINLYFSLFRKFWPRHYVVASIVSFFGLFPIFVFVVRNNRPIDYASFVRSQYQGYYNVYTPDEQCPPQKEKSPFEEYPNKEEKKYKYEDPFEEFSDKK